MNKKDLKDGMIIETDEDMYIKIGDRFVNKSGYITTSWYNDNLLYFDKLSPEFNVRAIYKLTNTDKIYNVECLFYKDNLELIWEREAERERFKKSDLKNGMIVQYRNGKKRIVIDDCLCGIGDNDNGHMTNFKYCYDDVLRYNSAPSKLDIVKVYDRNDCALCKCGKLLWEEK